MISGYPLTTYLDARLSWQVVYLQNQSYCDFHTLQAYSILSQKKCTSHIGYIYTPLSPIASPHIHFVSYNLYIHI